MSENLDVSFKEKRIRSVTQLYYSRKDVLKAIFDFSVNREISPRYFEGFGKRPDCFQYVGDIFELVRRGATSFHCSEELWEDPLEIVTGMGQEDANNLRLGWDLLIDIDCKWFEYSKLAADSIVRVLKSYGMNNVGVKFSGSKGFHILVPWVAFPKELGGGKTKNMFPDLPRKIVNFIRFKAEAEMKKKLPDDFYSQFKGINIKKGVKCNKCSEIVKEYEVVEFFCDSCYIGEEHKLEVGDEKEIKCSNCKRVLSRKNIEHFYECENCQLNSKENPDSFSSSVEIDLFELMGLDLVLVSSRHLFRMPYSLHEKTALSSVVIDSDKILEFQMKDASPMDVIVKDFVPNCMEGEASELVMQALDWDSERPKEEKRKSFEKFDNYKKIELKDLDENQFPPCINKILNGMEDGKKRGLFVLINLFRSVGMSKEEVEERINKWNVKNTSSLKQGYVKMQIDWAFSRNPIMPQNCKEFYQALGVCSPDNFCKFVKNPVNYVIKKNFKKNTRK